MVNIHAPAGFAYGLHRTLSPRSKQKWFAALRDDASRDRRTAHLHDGARGKKKAAPGTFAGKTAFGSGSIICRSIAGPSLLRTTPSVVIHQETWTMLQLKYNREIADQCLIRSPTGVERPVLYSRGNTAPGEAQRPACSSWARGWTMRGIYYLRGRLSRKPRGARLPDLRLDDRMGAAVECRRRSEQFLLNQGCRA